MKAQKLLTQKRIRTIAGREGRKVPDPPEASLIPGETDRNEFFLPRGGHDLEVFIS